MASGFSLAFTGKKQARRVDVQEKDGDDKREAVIGFGKGGLETAEPRLPGQEALIIPKQENTYRVAGGKFRPTYLPEAADRIDAEGIDKFEVAGPEVAQEKVTYGLQQRSRSQANGHAAAAARPDEQQHPGEAERETEALKRDLAELPAEAPLEAYDAMPVDKFGEALLRGMGWQEGRAIGRGGKGEVVAKELVRRPQRLGLGATPAPDTHQKKFIKPGESRDKKDLVYLDADGHVKSSKPVDEKLVERRKEGVHPGKVMRVVDGRHSGLLCEVVALEPKEEGRSERARVRLLPSHETVTVRCMELGERQEERPGSRGDARDSDRDRAEPSSSKHHHRHGAKRDGDDRSTRADQADKRQRSGSTGAAGLPPRAAVEEQQRPSGEEVEEEGTPWLAANIRVKVVDKRVRGGKLYLKKGVVVDVSQPTVCDVHFPDIRETVQHLRQSQLETVVPSQEGTPVLVLRGRLRGRRGRLLKRNTETGLAAVQLTSDLSLHKLSLDDISEFAGGHEED